jgi:HK97 family phage portal protein
MSFGARMRAAVLGAWQGWGGMALPWLGTRIQAGGASLPVPSATPGAALGLTAVYRACSLLADAASVAPPALYRKEANGGRQQLTDTAAARALATLSHADAELWAFGCALTGNGYLRIVRDGNGAPYDLRAVPPWRVTLEVEQGTGRLYYRIAADTTLEEREVIVPEADVVHARYRVTGANRLLGVPPVVSCAPAFALALQSRDVQRVLFANLATPRGALQAPGKIDPAIAKRAQAEWEANFQAGGLGKTAVLANGLEYKPIPLNAVDAQLLEQVEAGVRDIARAYGLPKQFLESGEQLTYASASEGTRALYSLALRGFCARLADALAQRLLTRNERAGGTAIEYDLSSMLVLPGGEQAEFLSKLANAGLATPNELRNQYLKLPDVEGGDVLRTPVNTTPAGPWAAAGKGIYTDAKDLRRWQADLSAWRQHAASGEPFVNPPPTLEEVMAARTVAEDHQT